MARPTVVPPGDIIFFISISYLTFLTFCKTSPVNFTVPTPRALGVGTVKFTGEVLQNVKNVRYEIDMKKIMSPGGTTVGLANGIVLADDKKIYSAESLKVGLFK